MIMVLQVGEQGQAAAQRRPKAAVVAVVVRLLFHAVSISAAAACARACCLARVLYLAALAKESGWAPRECGAPSFNERDGCLLPPLSLGDILL